MSDELDALKAAHGITSGELARGYWLASVDRAPGVMMLQEGATEGEAVRMLARRLEKGGKR